MTRLDKMLAWVNEQRQLVIDAGRPLFLGWPDEWYEPYRVCCENGHVHSAYLKSESLGGLCFECFKPVQICPNITEDELQKILNITEDGN